MLKAPDIGTQHTATVPATIRAFRDVPCQIPRVHPTPYPLLHPTPSQPLASCESTVLRVRVPDILPQPRHACCHVAMQTRARPVGQCWPGGAVHAPRVHVHALAHQPASTSPMEPARHVALHDPLRLGQCTHIGKEAPLLGSTRCPHAATWHTTAGPMVHQATLPLPVSAPCAWQLVPRAARCTSTTRVAVRPPLRTDAHRAVSSSYHPKWPRSVPGYLSARQLPLHLPVTPTKHRSPIIDTGVPSHGARWPLRVPDQPHPHRHVEQQRAGNQRRQGLAGTAGVGRA